MKDIEATLQISMLNKNQLKHIIKARKLLRKAGVTFDSGYDVRENRIDWELDYSLVGARLTKEGLVFNIENPTQLKRLCLAVNELKNANIRIESIINKTKQTCLWKFLSGVKLKQKEHKSREHILRSLNIV